MFTGLTHALKGIGGEYEINRLVGAFGAVSYVLTACGLVIWDVLERGTKFDLIAFCAAFPGGLGIAVGAIAGAVAYKDKAVASARVTEATGAIPTKAPDGPQVPTGTDVSHTPEVDLAP